MRSDWCALRVVPSCRTLEQAFADLRGLMAKAGEMVQLAERFRQALAERAAAGQAGVESGAEDWMDADMEAELISMGIASPVTKASAGALYHRELSRQVRACLGLPPACARVELRSAGSLWHSVPWVHICCGAAAICRVWTESHGRFDREGRR